MSFHLMQFPHSPHKELLLGGNLSSRNFWPFFLSSYNLAFSGLGSIRVICCSKNLTTSNFSSLMIVMIEKWLFYCWNWTHLFPSSWFPHVALGVTKPKMFCTPGIKLPTVFPGTWGWPHSPVFGACCPQPPLFCWPHPKFCSAMFYPPFFFLMMSCPHIRYVIIKKNPRNNELWTAKWKSVNF
jgi:hypothetical protein